MTAPKDAWAVALAYGCLAALILSAACDEVRHTRPGDVADGSSAPPNPTSPGAPKKTRAARKDAHGPWTSDPPSRPPTHEDAFFELADAPAVAAMANARPVYIRKGRGGRSLGFRITLRGGVRGYFKPEQRFSGAHWYSELAAYYLDREMGFGRVPASTGRRMRWSRLQPAAEDDRRIDEVIVDRGWVRGAFIHWIEGPIPPLVLERGWERQVRVEDGPRVSPYLRPANYRKRLRGETAEANDTDAEGIAVDETRAAELSDLIVFDYLIQNVDRWGGGYTNVRTRGPRGPLMFFDNGAGFWTNNQRLPLLETRLTTLQRFRRSTIVALKQLDIGRLRARMSRDPLAPILSSRQIEGIAERRRAALKHMERTIRQFGSQAVLDLP